MTPRSILRYFEELSVDCAYFDAWAEGAEATREGELSFQVARWAHGAGWRVR